MVSASRAASLQHHVAAERRWTMWRGGRGVPHTRHISDKIANKCNSWNSMPWPQASAWAGRRRAGTLSWALPKQCVDPIGGTERLSDSSLLGWCPWLQSGARRRALYRHPWILASQQSVLRPGGGGRAAAGAVAPRQPGNVKGGADYSSSSLSPVVLPVTHVSLSHKIRMTWRRRCRTHK